MVELTRPQRADRKRAVRAEKRALQVLAGGWGFPAQAQAWEEVTPHVRVALRELSRSARSMGRGLTKVRTSIKAMADAAAVLA